MSQRRLPQTARSRDTGERVRKLRLASHRASLGTTGFTSLEAVADSVVEACWLTAILALPLYFSVLTTTAFEADKAVLLRGLAAIAAAGWVAGQFHRTRGQRPHPIIWLALVTFGAFAVSAALSIDSRMSFFGSAARQEGLVTVAAYLVFLLCVATRLRRRSQLDRLITVMIFGSLPVAAYGFLQQLTIDPISLSQDPSALVWRTRSTFGQHVLLGSYLVLVIPFTVARVFACWRRIKETDAAKGAGDEPILAVLLVGLMVATFFVFLEIGSHTAAIFSIYPGLLAGYTVSAVLFDMLPDSRHMRFIRLWGYGGVLALQVVTLGFTGARGPWMGFFASVPAFGFFVAWWLRRPRIWWTVLAASAAVGVFVFALNIPGGPLQPVRTVGGLSRLANLADQGESAGSTQGRLYVWGATATLMTTNPSVGGSWSGVGRDVVGYGPDTMQVAFERVFPLKLRQITANIWSWDRAHDIYLDYLEQAGLLGLLALFGTIAVVFRQILISLRNAPPALAWPLMALGAAVVGHLVDGIFSLEIPVTLLYLWLMMGLVAAWPRLAAEPVQQESQPANIDIRPAGILGGVVLIGCAQTLLPSFGDHPELLAFFWLAGILVGVAFVSYQLVPTLTFNRAPAPRGDRGRERQGVPGTGQRRVMVGALGLAAALVLANQARYETAAFADVLGLRQIGQAQFTSAISYLQQAVQANAYEPSYHSDLAYGFLNLAVAQGPSANPTYHPTEGDTAGIGQSTYMVLGRDQLFQLSIYAFDKARSLDPLNPLEYDALGNAYLSWKRPAAAFTAFRYGASLSANNPKYVAEEAQALVEERRGPMAVTAGRAAVRLDPSYWYSHYSLALVYHRLKEKKLARSEAYLGLFWSPITYPAPPSYQLTQLKSIESTG